MPAPTAKAFIKSLDAGSTFERIGSPEIGVVYALAKSGKRLFAGTATQGISVSEDGRRTWKSTGVTPNTILIMSTGARGEVFAGTNFDGVFVHRAEQPARQWRRLAWQPLRDCACQNRHAIATDPGDRNHVFLSTNDGGLLVSEDGGRHWSDGGVTTVRFFLRQMARMPAYGVRKMPVPCVAGPATGILHNDCS